MGEHDGHRERLRRRYTKAGLDSFEPHEVLELLLTYVIPRRDTNPIAHALIDHFKSIDRVFDASPGELMTIDGIGESAALFLNLMPEIFRQYGIAKRRTENARAPLTNCLSVCYFMKPYYIGLKVEVCYLISLNSNAAPISVEKLATGTVSSVSPYFREIIDKLLTNNAAGAIICHNHPSGRAAPSQNDILFTVELDTLLNSADIPLIDHIIIGAKDYYSFSENKLIGPNRSNVPLEEINFEARPYPPSVTQNMI